jgi:type I restriction enzyme S subunit
VIALLNEQKQAIIHRAVTRGLDPSVPLKDSGVPWLGEIPKHWEVVPLKYLCLRAQNGSTPSTSEPRYYADGTVPWYGPSSIGVSSKLGAPVRRLTKAAFEHGRARLISGPAVLVVVIGATAGKIGLLAEEGATNQQITSFELRQDVVAPEFAIHQLRSSETWLKSTASTATIPILDSGVVNRLPMALPPTGEQERILASVSSQTLPLTTAILRLEREIALLREYRTRLVADVVTGKLDVRAAAASLLDEAPLDDATASPDPDDALDTDDLTDTEGDA